MTHSSPDIVERIRDLCTHDDGPIPAERLMDEAADTIEALREELESAKAQITIALKSNGFQLLGMAVPAVAATPLTQQHIIEGIILRRLHEKRIEGYTIEMAKEIAEALHGAAQPSGDQLLNNLVDWTWIHATEGAHWPSAETTAELIQRAKERGPTQEDAGRYITLSSTMRKAPASCPHCHDETDCSSVDICSAVEGASQPSVDARIEKLESEVRTLKQYEAKDNRRR